MISQMYNYISGNSVNINGKANSLVKYPLRINCKKTAVTST